MPATVMLCRGCGSGYPSYLVAAGVMANDEAYDECGNCGDQLLMPEEFDDELPDVDDEYGEEWL